MKFLLQKLLPVLLPLGLMIGLYCFIRSKNKEIVVCGFAYKNDIIRVKQLRTTFRPIVVDGKFESAKHVCSFYDSFDCLVFDNREILSLEIDSANIKLLDTVLVIPNTNGKSSICIEDPTTTNFKRRLFVTDKIGKSFVFQ